MEDIVPAALLTCVRMFIPARNQRLLGLVV